MPKASEKKPLSTQRGEDRDGRRGEAEGRRLDTDPDAVDASPLVTHEQLAEHLQAQQVLEFLLLAIKTQYFRDLDPLLAKKKGHEDGQVVGEEDLGEELMTAQQA